jgi:hypothetical protein
MPLVWDSYATNFVVDLKINTRTMPTNNKIKISTNHTPKIKNNL